MEFPAEFIGTNYISLDICDEIIDYFNFNSDRHSNGTVFKTDLNNNESFPTVDKSIKDSIDCELLVCDTADKYLLELQEKVLIPYIEKYKYVDDLPPFNIVEYLNIQKYPKNGGFKHFHQERGNNGPSASRVFVIMTYLNDINDGGETEFYYQNIKK